LRKACYGNLLSKEEIKGFGVNALDILDVEIKMDGVIVAVAHDEFKKKPFLSTGSFFQTLGKFNHQTFKKGLIQTNAFSKSLTKNISKGFSFSTNLFLGRKALPKELYPFLAQVLSCSLISQKVKILPVLFTRIGVEANSGRVSFVRGNLKSLRRSLARSTSEPVVGYAKRRPSSTLGKFDASMGTYKRKNYHRGLACLIRVGMKTKGWLGDRGRSRIVLERGKEGIT
jgi:hypothetical protein